MPEETPYNSETKRRSNKKAINWFSTNVTTKDKQNKSAKKDIEHPIFIQLSEKELDPFWNNVFKDCAYGKFPNKKFDYTNGEMIYQKGNRRALVSDIDKVAQQVKDFFYEFAKIKSPLDITLERFREESMQKKAKTTDQLCWKDVGSDKAKRLLFRKFSQKLTTDKRQQLEIYDLIKNGFSLGYLINKDVFFFNGEIKTIRGIVYDVNLGKYTYDPKRNMQKFKDEPKKINYSHSFKKEWNKICNPGKTVKRKI